MVYNNLFKEDFDWNLSITRGKIIEYPGYSIIYGEYKKKKTMTIYTDKIFPKIPNDISYLSINCKNNDVKIPELPENIIILRIVGNNFTKIPKNLPKSLKEIKLYMCNKIKSLESLRYLEKLKCITIEDCRNIKNFDKKFLPLKLEILQLDSIPIKSFPKNLPESLKEIYLRRVPIKYLPDLNNLINLEDLILKNVPIINYSKILQSKKLKLWWRSGRCKEMVPPPASYDINRVQG